MPRMAAKLVSYPQSQFRPKRGKANGHREGRNGYADVKLAYRSIPDTISPAQIGTPRGAEVHVKGCDSDLDGTT